MTVLEVLTRAWSVVMLCMPMCKYRQSLHLQGSGPWQLLRRFFCPCTAGKNLCDGKLVEAMAFDQARSLYHLLRVCISTATS